MLRNQLGTSQSDLSFDFYCLIWVNGEVERFQLVSFLADLEQFIRLEANSGNLVALEGVSSWIEEKFLEVGIPLECTSTAQGFILSGRKLGEGKKVLLLCHYDTVHPLGAFEWKLEGDKIIGPGVNDMKGSIVQLLWALKIAEKLPNIELLFTPDEETGSLGSREMIEDAAKKVDLVLVLESPLRNGDLKVARKAVGDYVLTAHGRAAHQGVEPEKGINAIVEIALQIPNILALQNVDIGTTLGPNVIKGGTVLNVVPDMAALTIDFRAWSREEFERVDLGLKSLKPILDGIRLELTGGLNRPAMEPTDQSLALAELAKQAGQTVGIEIGADRVGGGSDGNFTAALGIPTLDGLGLTGGDAHQKSEFIWASEVEVRVRLLANLLESLSAE